MGPDHYETLGVAPTADQRTLRAAYLARMRAVHPDRAPHDPEAQRAVRVVNVAYEVLSDPERRRRYDLLRASRRHAAQWPAVPTSAGTSVEELRRTAAARAAYSSHGGDFRRAFHRACLRVGIAVIAVGAVLLFSLGA